MTVYRTEYDSAGVPGLPTVVDTTPRTGALLDAGWGTVVACAKDDCSAVSWSKSPIGTEERLKENVVKAKKAYLKSVDESWRRMEIWQQAEADLDESKQALIR